MTASSPPTDPLPPAAPSDAPSAFAYGVPAADTVSPKRRGVTFPAWLAVVIAALAAGGFAYLGWRLLRPPPPVDLTQYDANDGRGNYAPARAAARRQTGAVNLNGNNVTVRVNPPRVGPAVVAPRPDGVTVDADGNGSVLASGLSVRFITTGGKQNLIATANPGIAGSPEDRSVVRARAIATNDNARAKAVGLNDEQIKKLRGTQLSRPQPIDAGTRAKLIDLWTKLRAADTAAKPAAQESVFQAVRAAAVAHTAADAAAYHAYAEQVRGILNAEQIAKLRNGG